MCPESSWASARRVARAQTGEPGRRATTAAASRPEASPGRLSRCIRVAGLKKLPGSPGTLLDPRLSAQTDRSQKSAKAAPIATYTRKMNTRFAKMPAAPPSPPTLPRQSFASLGSPARDTGEAWSRPAWTRGASAEERAWARYGQENALPASPAPESPASSPANESWRKPTWARGTSAEANAWEAAMRRPQ